jgi:hypothetical protein
MVAVSGLGTGLVHLAVGAGSPPPFFIVFVLAGSVGMVWAMLTLVRGRVPAPRAFAIVTLLPVAFWAASIALGVGGLLPLGPLAAASALGVISAGVVLFSLRRRSESEPLSEPERSTTEARITSGEEHPWRFIGSLAASAAIVAALVTPALSGTWAGQFAVPHGSHDLPGPAIEDEHDAH